MSVSAAEAEIRSAVIARLRELAPSARIIHELNVCGQGSNRIDVAAVLPQAIIGVEIKSERDTLKRLSKQWEAFSACCHYVVVAAHETHFTDWRDSCWRDDVPSDRRLNHPLFIDHYRRMDRVWRFPRPEHGRYGASSWHFCPLRDLQTQPKASAMLNMLWAEELRAECVRHRVPANSRSTRPGMIADMVWSMTGREICEAVCRQLRGRSFAAADPNLTEVA